MYAFHLTVFGPPELRRANGEYMPLRTRKHLALLIYLAVEPPTRHRRDRLASLLWPYASTDDARHSLATAIYALRAQMSAEMLDARRDSVQLTPGWITTDSARLLGQDVSDDDVMQLRPFLDDFDIDSAPGFQYWKDVQHARTIPLIHTLFKKRIEFARICGNSDRMGNLARCLMRIDDLNEEGIRTCVETYLMAGDRVSALRLYDVWRDRLHDELAASPSATLDRLIQRTRNGRDPQHAPPLRSVHDGTPPPCVFVGREREFAACWQAWQRAANGISAGVMLWSDSGMGKTALLDRLATSLGIAGAKVIRVTCFSVGDVIPFSTVAAVADQLLDLPGSAATSPAHLAELSRVTSRVRERYPLIQVAPVNIERTSRLLFAEAFTALVAAVADEQPVGMLIDDVHLCDAESLAVLQLLLGRHQSLALAVFLTSANSARQSEQVRQVMGGSQSIESLHVELDRMDLPTVNTLFRALVPSAEQPPAQVTEALIRGAGGNPKALSLLLADWRRRGPDCAALALDAMTPTASVTTDPLPRNVFAEAVAHLSPECRAVAQLAGLLGARLNDLAMYDVVGITAGQALRAMDALAACQVLRVVDGAFAFANEILRYECYVLAEAPIRQALHLAVANKVLVQRQSIGRAPDLEIARHFSRAHRGADAVDYLLSGSRDAIRRGMPNEALIALSSALPQLTGNARDGALLLLVESQQELGRWAESLQTLDLHAEHLTGVQMHSGEVFRMLARRWLGNMELAELDSCTARLVQIADSDIEIDTRVKALAAGVRMLSLSGNRPQLNELRTVAEHVRPIQMDEFHALHVLLVSAWIRAVERDVNGASAELMEGIQLAANHAIGSSVSVRLTIGHGNVLYLSGRYAEALPVLLRALDACRRLGNVTLEGECACLLALVEGRLGRRATQMAWAKAGLSSLPSNDWCAAATAASYELGVGLAGDGQRRAAQCAVKGIAGRRRNAVPDWAIQGGLLCAADVFAISGSVRKALKFARQATTAPFDVLHDASYSGQYARWISRLAVEEGHANTARERILAAFPCVDDLDAKDQVEVLASLATLCTDMPQAALRYWDCVDAKLRELPRSIGDTIRLLGFIAPPTGQ